MRFAEFTEGYSAGAVGGAGIGEATMDPDFKHELQKILSRNWKGASAEKILLDRFLDSQEGSYARNILGNDSNGWMKQIQSWLTKNQNKIKQEFSELDIADLDELAYNIYTSYMSRKGQLDEKWSGKYKKSINCNNPKGFSQKAHCAGRKARQAGKHTKSSSVNK